MENEKNKTELYGEQGNNPKNDKISIKISIKKISVKKVIIIAIIIASGILVYACKGLFIAATVDGSPISRLTVIKELEKASGKSLLDSFIVERLIQKEAKAKGITVSDEEVNTQITTIQDQIAAQGSTLEEALISQGMTMEDLKKQIIIQTEVEKLVADKISVTDEEVTQYITDNAISIPEGQEATTTAQIKEELRSQKLSTEGSLLVTTLKSQANIIYFVNY